MFNIHKSSTLWFCCIAIMIIKHIFKYRTHVNDYDITVARRKIEEISREYIYIEIYEFKFFRNTKHIKCYKQQQHIYMNVQCN